MTNSPNYGYYRKPRFSANHLATYLLTQTPKQREGVIRDAKFPRKPSVIPYSQSKKVICGFMAQNTGDLTAFDDDIARLETRWRREPDGWMKTELRRNIDAIKEFKKAFTKTRAMKYKFIPGPTDMTVVLERVRLNVRMDVTLSEEDNTGTTHIGGCVMILAAGGQARKNIQERSKAVAALIHWGLQVTNDNVEPLERLCMSFDVFGAKITKAPKAIDRLRANMTTACKEAAASWDGVEPPKGYDGPNWR